MGDPVRCLPKVVHPDVAALKLQHNRLEDPDAASFDIDMTSGQIRTKAALDHEAQPTHSVTVIVSDNRPGGRATVPVTITVTDVDEQPAFANEMETRSVAENTASGENVGAAVTATNPNNDTLTYTLGGTDVASFAFVSESGQILTSSALDHEVDDTYEVTVTAQTPDGLSATVPVTITVTDVDEPPETPDPPTVVGIAADSVQVRWTAPDNTGPAITDYDVRYQADGSESWTELDHDGTGLSITVTGLEAGTYAAQVRATNPEGTSAWSPSGTGTTKVAATEVASDWSLAPSGLVAGDTFRLLFVSSGTRDASSTDIGDYNTFVQGAAAAGHADIQAYSAGFRTVASTADVDARDNTGTAYTDDQKGPPIYWLGGAQLADHYEDFYDGSWDEVATGRDEAGTSVSFPQYDSNNTVWTGSERDGTEAMGSNGNSSALGTGAPVVGLLNFPFISQYGPLDGDRSETKASLNPLYGLSEVFQLADAAAMNTSTALELSVSPESVAEDAGPTTVTVTAELDGAARTTATTVTVSRTGGTATSGTDYAAVNNFTLTIPANQTSGTGTFTFTPTNDSAVESAETVILSGSATGLETGTATLTITDDDEESETVILSVSPSSVAEDAGPTTVTVTAELDQGARTVRADQRGGDPEFAGGGIRPGPGRGGGGAVHDHDRAGGHERLAQLRATAA